MNHVALALLFALLMLPGLALVLVPFLPSLSYMLFVAIVYGFLDGFVHLTPLRLLILSGILAAGIATDYLAGALGAKLSGAAKRSILSGFAGFFLGFVILPPFGGFLGLFAGVLAGELFLGKSREEAVHAAAGSLLGAIAGIAINELLAAAFFVLFLFFALG